MSLTGEEGNRESGLKLTNPNERLPTLIQHEPQEGFRDQRARGRETRRRCEDRGLAESPAGL